MQSSGSIKRCPKCSAILGTNALQCNGCGHAMAPWFSLHPYMSFAIMSVLSGLFFSLPYLSNELSGAEKKNLNPGDFKFKHVGKDKGFTTERNNQPKPSNSTDYTPKKTTPQKPKRKSKYEDIFSGTKDGKKKTDDRGWSSIDED